MKNNDRELSIKSVISSMKLSHLQELAKVFEIQVTGKRKNDFIEYVSLYIKNNISIILKNFIIYSEYEFMEEICSENYEMEIKEDYRDSIKCLEYLGIIYLDYDCNKEKVFMPTELKANIKQNNFDESTVNCLKKREELIELFKDLLDTYGIIPINVLIDYIIEYTGPEDTVHEALKTLWRYNFRNKVYYNDYKSSYCNIKIVNMQFLNKKLISNLNLSYKHYNRSQLKSMNGANLNYIENKIYIILKKYITAEFSLKNLEYIKIMIKNDICTREINEFIIQKIKILSGRDRNNIERLVNSLRCYYPLWTLKGHSLKDLTDNSAFKTD